MSGNIVLQFNCLINHGRYTPMPFSCRQAKTNVFDILELKCKAIITYMPRYSRNILLSHYDKVICQVVEGIFYRANRPGLHQV